MMSTKTPREAGKDNQFREQKRIYKTLHNERMTSVQADGLISGFEHLELVHLDTDFTPSPKQEKNKKAMPNSPSRTMADGITI